MAHLYEGHESEVTVLLPFGRHLLSTDKHGTLIVWDVHSEGRVNSEQSKRIFFFVDTMSFCERIK